MSRDWCPLEIYLARENLLEQQGEDLFEMGKRMVIVTGEKSKPIYSEEEIAFMDDYKWFGSVGRDVLMEIYRSYNDKPEWDNILETLNTVEKKLDNIISHITISSDRKVSINPTMDLDDDAVKKWFLGELDENFYYADWNNELFLSCILEECGMERKENDYESHLE